MSNIIKDRFIIKFLSCELVYFIYKETIIHYFLSLVNDIKRVLIGQKAKVINHNLIIRDYDYINLFVAEKNVPFCTLFKIGSRFLFNNYKI